MNFLEEINLLSSIYSNSLLAEITLLFIIAIMVFAVRIPEHEHNKKFLIGYRYYGRALIVLAISLLPIYWNTLDPIIPKDMILAIKTSSSYLFIRLLGLAAAHLLIAKIRTKINAILIRWVVATALLAVSSYYSENTIFNIAFYITITLVVLDIVGAIIIGVRRISNTMLTLEDYYIHEEEKQLKWVKESVIVISTWTFANIVLSFFGEAAQAVHAIIAIFLFTYYFFIFSHHFKRMYLIYVSKGLPQELTKESETNSELVPEMKTEKSTITIKDETSTSTDPNENKKSISDRDLSWLEGPVNKWVKEQGYLQDLSSIENLAELLNTNRTYLSQYINSKYDMNFRNWIASLRIAHAQQMMLENPRIPLVKVANTIKFSRTNFSTIFRKHTGVTISQWRASKNI